MATFRSIPQYKAYNKKRAKRLSKAGIKTSSQAASYMQARAIQFAPHHTGETIMGITKKSKGKQYIVESKVKPKGKQGFRQNLWANQTAPFRTPLWKHGNRKYGIKAGTRGLYGVSPSHFTWTGKPRFFHWATVDTQVRFRKLGRKNTRKALRVTV